MGFPTAVGSLGDAGGETLSFRGLIEPCLHQIWFYSCYDHQAQSDGALVDHFCTVHSSCIMVFNKVLHKLHDNPGRF